MTGSVSGAMNDGRAAFGSYAGGVSSGVQGYNNYYGNSIHKGQVEAENDPGMTMLGMGGGALARIATKQFLSPAGV